MFEAEGSFGQGTQGNTKIMSQGKNSEKKKSTWELEPFTFLRGVFACSLSPSSHRLSRPATGIYLSVISISLEENRVCFFPWENPHFHLCPEDSFCWRTAAVGGCAVAIGNRLYRGKKGRREGWGEGGIRKHACLSFQPVQSCDHGVETVLGSSNTDLGEKVLTTLVVRRPH